MAELWGVAAGQSARRQDDNQRMLAELAVRQGDAQIRESNVRTEGAELALEGQRKLIDLMNQKDMGKEAASPTNPGAGLIVPGDDVAGGIPDNLDELARLSLQSGLPQQAAEFASKASTLRSNASEIRQRQLAERISNLTLASNMLATVGDEQSWKQANALYAMTTGQESPFAHMPFSPELVAKIHDSVISEKDRAVTAAANARADASAAAAKADEARVPLINAQKNLANTRAAALKKAGVKPPPAADMKAVSDMIASEFLGSVTPEDARILARPVTERMQEIIQETQGISRAQAARRAFDEAMQRGDFGGLRPRKRMKGASPQTAMEMPSEQAKLRPNMYYKGQGKYAGKTLLWTGTGFKIAPAAAASQEVDDELDKELGGGDEGFDNEHTPETDESY